MNVLVTGAGGMLGQDLVKALSPQHAVSGFGTSGGKSVDITDQARVSKIISEKKPDIVIHAAAYTDVDGAEQNRAEAHRINVVGTEIVARAALKTGAILFFISTDYVFDGRKKTPYQEHDPLDLSSEHIGVYGKTKLEAEQRLAMLSGSIYIIRTSWLFGAGGKNFFGTILEKASENKTIEVVNDQKGAPTYTKDLSDAFRILIEKTNKRNSCEIYHLANSGVTTWYEAAKYLLGKTDFSGEILPISSEKLNRKAKRPANSVLNTEKIKKDFGIELRPWQAALDEFWKETLSYQWKKPTEQQFN